jgi:hypothetical protein
MHNLDSLEIFPSSSGVYSSKEPNRRKDLGEARGEGREDKRGPCKT